MVLYTYRFFSSSVHLVLHQLLGTQPHKLSKMLFTAARLIACSGVAGIWIANSWSEQRGGIERAGLWPLSHFRKLLASEDCSGNSGYTSKSKKASIFAKMGAAQPVGERWFWGGCWDFRLPWVLSTLVLFFPPCFISSEPWVWKSMSLEKTEWKKKNGWIQVVYAGCIHTCSFTSLLAAHKGPAIWEAASCNWFHEPVSTG